MQLFKLNSVHKPGNSVKNFDSLVWVERYQTAGDFRIEVEKNVSILQELPLGVLISHTDTLQVMIVENHEVVRDSQKKLKVIISGRSFETFSENRPSLGSELPLYDPTTGVKNSETTIVWPAEYIAMWLMASQLEEGTASADDAIPFVGFLTDIREIDDPMEHVIKRGNTYSQVLEFLKLGNVGIKTARPSGGFTTLNVIVHDGADKRQTVIFRASAGDLDEAQYFWSIKGYKNYAQIAAHEYARLYRSRDEPTALTGLQRRTLYVEADDIEGVYTPPTATDVISGRGQVELNLHKKMSLLTAKVAKTAKPRFKVHYDVGDLVTAFGEFAASQTMRVTEHILTVDKDGMRGFPSLTAI